MSMNLDNATTLMASIVLGSTTPLVYAHERRL